MNQKQEIGKMGEKIAKEYLIENGYEILRINCRCKFGEVDIVATNGNKISFVEVKTRTNIKYGTPAEAITYEKQKHMYKVAMWFLKINKIDDVDVSIDVIEVYLSKNESKVQHIQNAIWNNPCE